MCVFPWYRGFFKGSSKLMLYLCYIEKKLSNGDHSIITLLIKKKLLWIRIRIQLDPFHLGRSREGMKKLREIHIGEEENQAFLPFTLCFALLPLPFSHPFPSSFPSLPFSLPFFPQGKNEAFPPFTPFSFPFPFPPFSIPFFPSLPFPSLSPFPFFPSLFPLSLFP